MSGENGVGVEDSKLWKIEDRILEKKSQIKGKVKKEDKTKGKCK